jgi:hypothetical protein
MGGAWAHSAMLGDHGQERVAGGLVDAAFSVGGL